MKIIIRNKVRWKKCNDIIKSKNNYDFRYCKCGSIFVDGGKEYQKFGWALKNPEEGTTVDDYINLSYSIYEENG